MPAKKRRREEWIDPRAPTELIGELAARCSDLEDFIRDSIEVLSRLGVEVVLSDEAETYELRCRNREVVKIARDAYDLGYSFMELKALRHDLDLLLAKHAGSWRSAASRTKTKQRRDAEFLQAYATRMKEEGRVEIKTLAEEIGVGKSTAYSIVQNLSEFLENEARRLRHQQPRLPRRAVVDSLVERHGDRPGVNRQTVEKAIAGVK
jgi:hypothetical protein